MRLNWCLLNSLVGAKDLKPVTPDEYLLKFGLDLAMPDIIQSYIAICLVSTDHDKHVLASRLKETLQNKTTYMASLGYNATYNLWDGVSVELNFYKPNSVGAKMPATERHLKITYLHVNRTTFEQNQFELHFTKGRYTHICPLEYYNYTHDLIELDPK